MKLKKGVQVIITILVLLVSINFIIAPSHPVQAESDIDKAYSCLEEELGDNCGGTTSTKQAAFNLLASSYDSGLQADCKASLNDKKKDVCWGKTDTTSCNIKSTALATLALHHIGENVDDQTEWLLDNKKN